MSAIAGIYHLQHGSIDSEQGPLMMKTLQKYPADRVLTWQDRDVFFGCHAQWITPESIHEVLPYYDVERGLAITSDAIIDNRTELFEMLQVPKSDQLSIPDSLLILLAYEKWGNEAPSYLVGDFAFMIWDEKRRSLFGARDFSGSRTLYFHRTAQLFAFSTIIAPLFSLVGVNKVINEQWASEFLTIPISTDAIDSFSTIYKGIEQLAPSHSITILDGRVSFSRYCRLYPQPKLRLKSNGEYEEAFREVFGRAVSDRLRTHHEVGAHLSGGLDSGSVVSFAAGLLRGKNKPLHTFSSYPVDGFVDFNLPRRFADERPYIQSTIDHVGNIEPNFLNFPEMNPYSEIDDWLDTLEMPYKFFENSYWLKGIYDKASAKGVGILLSGQRGNWTISWGPALDYQARLIKQFSWVRFFWENRRYTQTTYANKKQVLQIVGTKVFPPLARFIAPDKEEPFPVLINSDFARTTNVHDRLRSSGIENWGSGLDAYDIRKDQFNQLYFWNINGTISTKLSLKYRIWDRDATNDLRVIRFCLSVPENQYVQEGVDRSLIRRAMIGLLPDKIRLNRKTRGVQGADGVHRMLPNWNLFVSEAQAMIKDIRIAPYLNTAVLNECLNRIRTSTNPAIVDGFDFRILMRGLIFYRFIQRLS
ncbi:asparagine synthase-related protein [Paenibacillus wynnii]|uniref:asparagine synthase-related protein n=1 Tax=Paenibacillus wynnii TaxID=268407 RepID=UPI0027907A7D|nr:asparagine synthase-related protein [Paenibacillus wynnii]MDQ0194097.1 asparagine synthase (glutamine-hydrolyzing) [Paenibacillus wynnii]